MLARLGRLNSVLIYDAINKGNLKKWVLNELIPNLHEPTCIVEKPPSSINRKFEIAKE